MLRYYVRKFVSDESGSTAAEKGLIAAGIALAIFAAVGLLGDSLFSDMFATFGTEIGGQMAEWLILAAIVGFGFTIWGEIHSLGDELYNWHARSTASLAASLREINSNLDVIAAYARRRQVRDSMSDPK